MPDGPATRTKSLRADADAWEVLEWWATKIDVPLCSMLRQAIEECADEIIAAFYAEIDEDMPPSVLLKRVAYRLDLPKRAINGMRPTETPPETRNPSTG